MERRGLDRYAPLAGVIFFVLAAVAILVLGDTPDADAKLSKVVKYWHDHHSREIVNGLLAAYGALFLVWFGGALRSALWRAEGGSARLSSVAFAGTVIAATGLAVNGALNFAAADTQGDITPQATQAISAVSEDFFFPFAVGFALMTLASGLVILRSGVLPRWLGFVSLAIGIISVTPLGFIGFLASLVWVGVVGVLLFLRWVPETPVGAAAAGAAMPPPARTPA